MSEHDDDALESIDALYAEEGSVSEPVETRSSNEITSAPAPAAQTSNIPEMDDRPGIERYLAEYGIEGGMITFEDGEAVHINDLSPEEQHVVLNSLAIEARPTIEQLNELNEDEIGFLNMARQSGKPITDVIADLANQQLDNIRVFEESQQVDWDNMSGDAVYLAFLKDKNPDMSDEQLQEDLDKARETRTYETVVKGIRNDFKSAQDRARQEYTQTLSKRFDDEIETDRAVIVESVAGINEVAGFSLTDDMKNYLLADMVEVNDAGDSILLEQIFSDPQKILEHSWFAKYGKDSINQMENYWKQEASKAYARGRAEALGKLPESDIPARVGGISARRDTRPTDGFNTKPDATTIDDLYND